MSEKEILMNICKWLSYKHITDDIDINGIIKLIKSYNYNMGDIFYNLEFPTSWKNNKKSYSDLKFLVDNVSQFFEDNIEYKYMDLNKFWIYFKKNLLVLLNNLN